MNVLVTGGAGFIGSALVHLLADSDEFACTVVDKMTYAANPATITALSGKKNVAFVQADVCDKQQMVEVFDRVKPSLVFHLAAESHVDRSITAAGDFIQTNIVGTFVLLEAARGWLSQQSGSVRDNFRFVHVSTDEVYGSLGAQGLFTEQTPFDPSSPYSASKAASDHLCTAWQRTYDLPVLISNCSNNYGPRQFPEKLIPLTLLNALENKPISVYGDGQNIRDWLYVFDHAHALLTISQQGRPGETYNVGGENERSNLDVVQAICDRVSAATDGKDRKSLIRFVTDRPGHDQRYAIDASKIGSDLGWAPKESFETGLDRTVEWYLQNDNWWRSLREKSYDGRRLGLIESET